LIERRVLPSERTRQRIQHLAIQEQKNNGARACSNNEPTQKRDPPSLARTQPLSYTSQQYENNTNLNSQQNSVPFQYHTYNPHPLPFEVDYPHNPNLISKIPHEQYRQYHTPTIFPQPPRISVYSVMPHQQPFLGQKKC
jgi:hypothetical protein